TNNGDQAYAYLGRARQAATQLGVDRNDYHTEFGPTNVLLYEVNIAVELGDAGHALRVAGKADTAGLSAERQARLLIEVARAHAQRRQGQLMVSTLRQAEQIAPEQVHTHPLVRELVEDALRSDQGDAPELRELAKDLGLIT
ncbi:MAG: XRE family transcriptional regulator, partial [Pseudonocardiales bacterium]|nr:XRE family transcriptional regulator [Pseudonocardiales bacterium]